MINRRALPRCPLSSNAWSSMAREVPDLLRYCSSAQPLSTSCLAAPTSSSVDEKNAASTIGYRRGRPVIRGQTRQDSCSPAQIRPACARRMFNQQPYRSCIIGHSRGVSENDSHGCPTALRLHRRFPVLLEEPFDKSRIKIPRAKIRIGQNLAVQGDRRIHALDDEHLQGS